LEFGLKIDEDNKRTEMSNSDDKKSLKEIAVQNIYGTEIIKEKKENKILIHSDGDGFTS
jgi:hypothetical protein